VLTTLNHLLNFSGVYFEETEEEECDIVPFVACGNSDTMWDPDMNYSLSTNTNANIT